MGTRPTRTGWATLALAAGLGALGRVLGLVELYAIAATLGLLTVVSAAWVTVRSVQVRVERTVRPSRVHVGDPSRVSLRLTNAGRARTPVLGIHEPITGTGGAALLVAPVRAGARTEVAYALPTLRRGLLTVGPMRIEVTDPFGLATARLRGPSALEVTVLPRVVALEPMARTLGPDPSGGTDVGSLGRGGEDFAALRPYVIGDDMRRVHWASSARSVDDLLVRQDEVPWQGRATVLLDLRPEVHDASTIELAVSIAASALLAHLRRADEVRLLTSSGYDSSFGTGHVHRDSVMEHLATATASSAESLDATLRRAARGGGGTLLAVTGRPPVSDLDGFDRAVQFSERRVVRTDVDDRARTARGTAVLGVSSLSRTPAAWASAARRRR